jgi:hypothetical protein
VEANTLVMPYVAVSRLLDAEYGAWTRYLNTEEIGEMRGELISIFMTALATGDWSQFQDARDAWRASAEVLSDPGLTARLLADSDASEEAPLARP